MSTIPGFKTRITKKGLNYANTVAIESLAEKLVGASIQDIEGESGHVKYEITSLNIHEFVKPNSSITFDPSGVIIWKANGANISGNGRWHYKVRHRLLKLSDKGKFDIRIRNICFNVQIEIGTDESGRPTISSKACTCDIDKVDITFHGGAAKFYNLFKGNMGHRLKHLFMDKMCDVIKKLVDKDGKESMEKLPVTIEIDKTYLLDYRLLGNPNFTDNYIETHHKGEVFWKSDLSEAPFEVQQYLDPDDEDKMAYFWTSSYLFNTYLYQAHRNEKMRYVITSKSLPEKNKDALKTTSMEGLFIGLLIPQIASKYPDSELEIHVRIEDKKIVGRVGNLNIKTKVTDSNIGTVSDEAVQFLIDYALRVYAEPMLNKKMQKGFPLPVSQNVTFENHEVRISEGVMILGTDIVYTSG
ncbi:hypothetical protein KUTeg_019842 [Tegillarca granosa]|uniref:Uncharacterized protein n=1 Tax=Tegillarca granosa TaxID=220873 RepID=A0ABQ9EHV0_TEGGR|nr:hypothetical protein KUTeg_019842 [Tegillarca granosa]